MTPSLVTVLFAALSFVVTFTIARALAKWWKKKNEQKAQEEAYKGLSRQARRAKQRKDAGR